MRILYIGDDNLFSTSYHRYNALLRLGHDAFIANPYKAMKKHLSDIFLSKFHYRTGYRFLEKKMLKWLERLNIKELKPDLIWINGGELLGEKCLRILKKNQCPVILYNNDDPTNKKGGRDGHRFDSMLKAISYYDLCVVMRERNIDEYKAFGAKEVIRVTMSYDEVIHSPILDENLLHKFKSKVSFIGTWMRYEKRDEFLLHLINNGVPLSIWGMRWEKSPYWQQLKPYYRGGALGGKEYVAAIQGAKVCLGLLSKGNRDLHTTRSLEVPFAGGLLCAERTSEHLAMYKEGEEAVFWSDADECLEICKKLLADDTLREEIQLNGMRRVRLNKVGNEDICKEILSKVEEFKKIFLTKVF